MTETYEDGPPIETYEQSDPEWGHEMHRATGQEDGSEVTGHTSEPKPE